MKSQWGEFRIKNTTVFTFLDFFFIIKFVFLPLSFPFFIKYQIFATGYKPIRNMNC